MVEMRSPDRIWPITALKARYLCEEDVVDEQQATLRAYGRSLQALALLMTLSVAFIFTEGWLGWILLVLSIPIFAWGYNFYERSRKPPTQQE